MGNQLTAFLGIAAIVGIIYAIYTKLLPKSIQEEIDIRTILYFLLLPLGFIGGVHLLNNLFDAETLKGNELFILISYTFALGLIHLLVMFEFLNWTLKKAFWEELFFTTILTILGCSSAYYLERPDLLQLYFYSFILFPLPYFIGRGIHLYYTIPELEYEQWYYNPTKKIDVYSKRTIVVFMHLLKHQNSIEPKEYKIPRMALDRPIGDIFHYFLYCNQLEQQHEHIDIQTDDNKDFTWLFYVREKGKERLLNHKLTLFDCKIQNEALIIAKRTGIRSASIHAEKEPLRIN